MYARVSTLQGPTDKIDEGIALVRERTIPAVKQIDGFKGMVSLIDRETGKSLTVTLWETEEALRASEEEANRIRSEAAEGLRATGDPIVDVYEVAAYEVASPSRV